MGRAGTDHRHSSCRRRNRSLRNYRKLIEVLYHIYPGVFLSCFLSLYLSLSLFLSFIVLGLKGMKEELKIKHNCTCEVKKGDLAGG